MQPSGMEISYSAPLYSSPKKVAAAWHSACDVICTVPPVQAVVPKSMILYGAVVGASVGWYVPPVVVGALVNRHVIVLRME